ncbi:hypothetical protein WJX81_003013 [Elliptochloris bilobata]|uniref:UFSP1/2/DUB catalytic domain-containing protein n=1 Tax=Elliptochloris bilobata TaxID=381761 RepID=A0AAW1RTP0_9CHLO
MSSFTSLLPIGAVKAENIAADLVEASELLPGGLCVLGAWSYVPAEDNPQPAAERLRHLVYKQLAALDAAQRAAPLFAATVSSAVVTFFQLTASAAEPTEVLPLAAGGPAKGDDASTAAEWLAAACVLFRCQLPLQLQVYSEEAEGPLCASTLDSAYAALQAEVGRPDLALLVSLPDGGPGSLVTGRSNGGSACQTCGNMAGASAGTAAQPLDVALYITPPDHEREAALGKASGGGSSACTDAPSVSYQPVSGGPVCLTTAPLLLDPLPSSETEADVRALEVLMQPERALLHRRLRLPLDRPQLRAAQALCFNPHPITSPSSGAGRLSDVHVGLPPPGVPGGVEHVVAGSYDYYHYCQDRFDDDKWGCAYRSLQTLCSWFHRQHYASMPVPSHAQIQRTLVDLGDKPCSFVGSKQWIGAIELGYVLDELLGVTCKVITVASGDDMPAKARELAHHFDTQGTPVMIGGGVLAYTLLGVCLNAATGECAFLILDPHYTGADSLDRVRSGGWVAWKRADGRAAGAGGELFVRGAFYNLLCPQRPVCI